MADEKILSLEEIYAANDLEYLVEPVPEWGGSIVLGELDAGTMLEFRNLDDKTVAPGLWLLSQALCDKDHNRIGSPAIVERMLKKNRKVVNRLVGKVLAMNELSVQRAEIKNDLGETAPVVSPSV